MSEIRQRYIRCDGPHCHKIETFWAADDFELSQEMQLAGWESQPPHHLCPICKARAAAVQASAWSEPGTDAYLAANPGRCSSNDIIADAIHRGDFP